MALIAIALAIMSVGHVPGIFYKAIGRPDILNRLSLLKLPIIIGIVWFATRRGIVGVSIGQIVFAIFAVLMDSYIVSRIIKFPVIETVRALYPAFTCTISMVFVTLLVKFLFSPSGFLGLFFVVSVGVLSFLVTLRLVEPELVKSVSNTVKNKVFQVKTV